MDHSRRLQRKSPPRRRSYRKFKPTRIFHQNLRVAFGDKQSATCVRCSTTSPRQKAIGITGSAQKMKRVSRNPPTSSGRSQSRTQPWWTNSLTSQKSTPGRVKSKSPRATAAGRRKTRTAPPAMPVTRSSTSFRLRLKVSAFSRCFLTILWT